MGKFGEHLKLKESLRYISLNKVRIASFKDKYYKKFFNDLVNDLVEKEYTEE